MRRHRDGFTLIELAIVLLIIAISVTIVFPRSGAGLVQRTRLQSSVNRIASFAEYAHQRAACARLTHLLQLDVENGIYWVTGQTSDGQASQVSNTLSLRGRLPEGVHFVGVELRGLDTCSQDVVAIRFSPQGWADPAVIHLVSSTGETMSVMIDELSSQVETYESKEMN
ncbi:MAG: hypothetical protein AMJ75_00100 [Phycisphaerae bacterium SM1_79]|nr:MAG: hypothetical protein AMJ75_00100 [Phycisphaerae bacterium SM1_79]